MTSLQWKSEVLAQVPPVDSLFHRAVTYTAIGGAFFDRNTSDEGITSPLNARMMARALIWSMESVEVIGFLKMWSPLENLRLVLSSTLRHP
jgi:hypothetical protein